MSLWLEILIGLAAAFYLFDWLAELWEVWKL